LLLTKMLDSLILVMCIFLRLAKVVKLNVVSR
jgi:hypothetical protein